MSRSWTIAISGACIAALSLAIAWYLHRKRTNEQKLAETAQVYRLRAEHGDAAAQADLGYMYAHGQGVVQNYAEALRWRLKSAEQGNSSAEDGLAFMYTHGQGVQQDFGKALFWRRKAADQGDAKAQYDLGLMYYRGEGVPQSFTEALRWYQKSASQGYASGQYSLGFMYYYGYGVPQDRSEADRWFQRAAEQGDPDARRTIGWGLTPWRETALLIEIIGGVLLILGSLFAKWAPVRPRRNIWLATGILCIFTAAISWYEYTHHFVWRIFGTSTFSLIKWLLDAVLVTLLFLILRSKNRSIGSADNHGEEI